MKLIKNLKLKIKNWKRLIPGFLIILISLFAFARLTARSAEAAWFDDTWAYRQKVTFTHTADITSERRVTVTIDTTGLVTNSKIQSTCNDARFTDSGGKLLRYQLTSACNLASTTFDVIFPTINNGANLGYFYYGNPGTISRSDSTVSSVTSLGSSTDTGLKSPTSTGEDYNQWATASNGFASDNAYATEITAAQRQDYYNFTFGIPASAAINGIEVVLEANMTGTGAQTGAIIGALSWDGGTTYTAGKTSLDLVATDATYTLPESGGSTDTWGRTWTDTEFSDANFRVRLEAVLCEACSLLAGSLVLDVRGQYRPIETFAEGEYVLSYDPQKQQFIKNQILQLNSHPGKEIYVINDEVKVTDNELIYTAHTSTGTFDWISISQLMKGDWVLWENGKRQVQPKQVYSIEKQTGNFQLYTLVTEQPFNNYWVNQYLLDTHSDRLDQIQAKIYYNTGPSVTVSGEEQGPAPTSYWNFDEAQGATANDYSTGSNNDLTITNALWRTSDQCVSGNCLYFDGNADRATKSYSSDTELLPGTTSFTVSAWLKHTSTAGADTAISRVDAVAGVGWKVYMDSSGFMCFGIDQTAGSFPVDSACSTTSYADSQWHFVTAVKSTTSSITIYIDGNQIAQDASITATTIDGTNAPFTVGNDFDNGTNGWDGFIDEVKYSNFAKTAPQITTEFASRSTTKGVSASFGPDTNKSLSSGLVGYWKMDENTGTSAADSSGNTNTGTLTSGPTWSTGKFGSDTKYDGTNDYTTVADSSSLDISSDFTLSLWFNPDEPASASADYIRGLIDKGSYRIFLDKSDGKLKAEANNGGTTWAISYDNVSGDLQEYETIWSLAVYNGKLYAGMGNAINEGDVWSFDGATWAISYDNVDADAQDYENAWSLAVYNGKLYAGMSSGVNEGDVWEFNGATWAISYDNVAADAQDYEYVSSLAVFNGKLYAGVGSGVNEGDVWSFDGATWAISYNNVSADAQDYEFVWSLAVYNGKLYAGVGDNTNEGDVWSFDGATWAISYDNVSADAQDYERVISLAVYNGKLYAGMGLNGTDGDVWSFDGATWAISYDVDYDYNTSLAVYAGKLYAAKGASANDGDVWVLDAGGQVSSTTTSWSQSTWQHATVTKSGTTLSMYVNGSLQSQTTLSSATVETNALPLLIGEIYGTRGTGAGEGIFKGKIDETRIYNRPLGPNEIAQLFTFGPGPVGWWKVDENTGSSPADSSGNGQSGSFTGTPSWVSGKFGSALYFNGSSQAVTATLSVDPGYSNSVELWVYPTSSIASKTLVTASKLTTNASSQPTYGSCTGSAISLNTWTHIVATSTDSTHCAIYQNGVLTASSATTGITFGTSVNIAASSFAGNIDDVRVYNYPRTSKQIVEDMNAGHPAGGSPIGSQVIYYKLDEQTGTGAGAVHNSVSDTTLTGNITEAAWKTETNCKLNGCLDFDGTNDIITTTNANPIDFDTGLNTGVTFSAWINPDTIGEGTGGEIFRKSATTFCRLTGSTPFNLVCSFNLGTDATKTVSSVIPASTWTHVAVGWADDIDDEISIWINGVLRGVSADGVGPPDADTSDLLIGGGTTNNFDGKIDEFKIYSSELTPSEILIDMNAESAAALGGVLGTQDNESFAGDPPVGWWKMDENTGTSANDSSGSQNNLTIQSGATWSPGHFGSSVVTDNTHYGQCSDASCGGTGATKLDFGASDDFTLQAWIKTSNSGLMSVINKGETSSVNIKYGMYVNSATNYLRFQVADGVDEVNVIGTTALNDNKWHFVALTFDNTNAKVFVDGIQENSGSVASIDSLDSSPAPFLVGALYQSSNDALHFYGQIDEVRVYRYARTQAQIAYDYNRGAPIAHYKFDECSGSTAYNAAATQSAQLLNGTINARTLGNTSVGDCTTSGSTMRFNGAAGKYNASLDFDSSDDDVSVANNDVIWLNKGLANGLTISTWIYPNTSGEGSTGQIFSKGASIYCQTTGSTPFNIACSLDLGTDATLTVNSVLTANSWNNVVMSWTDDGDDEITLWVNGRPIGTSANGVGPTSVENNSLIIGNNSGQTATFDGQIDDFKIFSYEMTTAQIQRLYNEGSAVRFGPQTGSP